MTTEENNKLFQTIGADRYFEDYIKGAVHTFGKVEVVEEEVIEFAIRFDPHDFHVDPEKARDTPFGGLIASGWHTGSLMMRFYMDYYLSNASSLGSPGLTQLRWLIPVRPDDELSVRVTIRDARASSSKPDRGVVTTFIEVLKQDGGVVMDMEAVNMISKRPQV